MPILSADLAPYLRSMQTVAVVGCSPRASQTSHRIARYLQDAGCRVVPVNPHHETLLGEPCYPSLLAVPEDVEIDVVDVFRRAEHTAAVAQDAADRAERTGRTPLFWTQLGVHSDEAQQIAEAAGLPYVRNRCLMVDHAGR